ncbi:type II secretion system F family protein [Frankia nepalensis]|uniref:type II secretion system F family protein n=1 Tax=Frankia nepalensis TaxID=1836974 RepID=UPI0027DC90EE|nr:type II secretion system F family protein [Frankia nepalensis]
MTAVALALAVLATAVRAARRAAARRADADARAAAEDLLAAFAAELDAGADPDAALRAAVAAADDGDAAAGLTAEHGAASETTSSPATASRTAARQTTARQTTWPAARRGGELAALRAGLAVGADPAELLAGARTPALAQLGAALRVCRAGGARLAPVARTLAEQARADARRAGELAAALAGPRSSGRLVAGLPVVGIAFAALLGANPAHVLLDTPAGSLCLAAGVLLDLLGLRWLRWTGDRVARHASAPTGPPEREGPEPRARGGARRWTRPLVGATLAGALGTASATCLSHGQRALGVALAAGAAAPLVGAALPADPYRRRRARLLADLPLALDLIAACLAAGATTPAALAATAAGIGGPLGTELAAAARGLRLGASVPQATARLLAAGTAPPGRLDALWRRAGVRRSGPARPLVAAALALGRVENSGARLAETLARIAARARAQAHDEAIGAARRAGVAAVAPLGLCFLPAFLLLGVVPTVLGSLPSLPTG